MTSHRARPAPAGGEPRRAAVRAQVAPLPEFELRIFVEHLARLDLATVELALADFPAIRASVAERLAAADAAGMAS